MITILAAFLSCGVAVDALAESSRPRPLSPEEAVVLRHDFGVFIEQTSATPPQDAALAQMSDALTLAVVIDMGDPVQIGNAARKIANATACLHAMYGSATGSTIARRMEKVLTERWVRKRAYAMFSQATSGQPSTLPNGDGCASSPAL